MATLPPYALLFAVLLAGCAGDPGLTSDGASNSSAPGPLIVAIEATACNNLILFQLLDFDAAEPYLPPGFHARDASELLDNPAVVGKTAMVLVTLDCTVRGQPQPWQPAFLELFVEHPVVPEVNGTARFDFYEVERYGDTNELAGAVRAAGWRLLPANVSIDAMPVAGRLVTGSATLSDDRGTLVNMMGSAPTPLNLDFGQLRFWQQTPTGLGFFETSFPIEPGAGGAVCSMRADSTAAKLAGSTTCPPGTPLLASFTDLSFNSRFVFLSGVRAR